MTFGPGHPFVEAGIEFVDATCGELDDLSEFHD
jgi:hypothetical protein